MKRFVFHFLAILALASAFPLQTNPQSTPQDRGRETQASDRLIAIDVLLEPDHTMISKANAVNARLRENYPEGYALDATHAPHITLLQRYVREKDFDAVTAALTKVFATEHPTELQLKETGIFSTIWSGVAVTVFVVERTPELMQLQQKVVDTVAPFSVSGGTSAAFIDTPSDSEIVGYVEQFVPKSSGKDYMPHVTLGVAHEDFVKQLKAEPTEGFSFKATGVAVYQRGNFGTASKKLPPTNSQRSTTPASVTICRASSMTCG